jgi:hypothetical protein
MHQPTHLIINPDTQRRGYEIIERMLKVDREAGVTVQPL